MNPKFYWIGFLLFLWCCRPINDKAPYSNAAGYVVGMESCSPDSTQNPWIVDFSYPIEQPSFGDSIRIGSVDYLHAVRCYNLSDTLKHIGVSVPIAIDFHLKGTATVLDNCIVGSPVIYKLQEIDFISGGFIVP